MLSDIISAQFPLVHCCIADVLTLTHSAALLCSSLRCLSPLTDTRPPQHNSQHDQHMGRGNKVNTTFTIHFFTRNILQRINIFLTSKNYFSLSICWILFKVSLIQVAHCDHFRPMNLADRQVRTWIYCHGQDQASLEHPQHLWSILIFVICWCDWFISFDVFIKLR